MRSVLAIVLSGVLTLSASPAYAIQKGHGPKVKPAQAPKAHAPKTHAPKAQAPKVKSHTVKSHTVKAKPVKSNTVTSNTVKSNSTKKTTTTTSTTTPTLTPVQLKLQRNTNLANKLSGRLPAGTDLMKAAEGFRNLGQFVAAVNVSNNLGIPFADLKTAMVVDGKSLGQAIKSERPRVDSTTEVRRAETDATRLIDGTDTTRTTTTTTTTTKKTKTAKTAKAKARG